MTQKDDNTPRPDALQRLLLVTGPSGAGRSTAINALEDIGYEVIDNLPLSLLPRLLDGPPLERPLALGIDVRNRDFSTETFFDSLKALTDREDLSVEVLFLECRSDVLLRRYSETRRRHPLALAEGPEIGIAREADILIPIRLRADIILETSELTPHQLKAEINDLFASGGSVKLTVTLNSFSYKRGIPRGADMIFDCRFLKNPYWEPKLRESDGRDPDVVAYVEQDKRFQPFFDRIEDLAQLLLPAYIDEGKTHFSMGFGCTGGQHRSVMMTEKMAATLREAGWQVVVRHRELERRAQAGPKKRGDAG